MARDYIYNEKEDIVVVVDNCGAVGNMELDCVASKASDVAYYSARVAIMELLSISSFPLACALSIFNPQFYDDYMNGINKAFLESKISVPIITSTETNFEMQQSAFSITLIGKGKKEYDISNLEFGVLGTCYVGNEVLENEIISLEQFINILKDKNIKYILPVGSKGIKKEFEENINKTITSCNLDVNKSAGPSTAIIIGYENEESITNEYGTLFTKIHCN